MPTASGKPAWWPAGDYGATPGASVPQGARPDIVSPPSLDLKPQGPGFSSDTVTPVRSPPVAPPLRGGKLPARFASAVTSDSIEPVDRGQIALPGPPPAPSTGERFHITADVPPADKQAVAAAQQDETLGRIEALVDRNSRVLEGLLKLLVKKGVLPAEDVRRMLGTRR